MERRFVRLDELATTKGNRGLLPVSKPTIWRWIKAGTFPAPIRLGPAVSVYDLDEVHAFIANQSRGHRDGLLGPRQAPDASE